jgi:hypothetical protein
MIGRIYSIDNFSTQLKKVTEKLTSMTPEVSSLRVGKVIKVALKGKVPITPLRKDRLHGDVSRTRVTTCALSSVKFNGGN